MLIMLSTASKAFNTFSQTTVEERLALLGKIVEVYQIRYDEIAETISSEMGAPLTLSKAAQAATGLGHLPKLLRFFRVLNGKKLKEKLFLEESLLRCGDDNSMELAN